MLGFHRIHAALSRLNLKKKKSRHLTTQMLCMALGNCKRLVISVSHDDYIKIVGGIQIILNDECQEFNRRGIDYLHLCPAQSSRGLDSSTEPKDFEFLARLNGHALGHIDGHTLQETLEHLIKQGIAPNWILHHLMGHSPEVLHKLIDLGFSRPTLLWTHDYFAACPSFNLMRDDAVYCDAPPPQSSTCSACKYGQERSAHMARIRRLILQIQPTIVAPSQTALELWVRATGISPSNSTVIPPVRLILEQQPRTTPSRPLRVAYLGRQDHNKGWSTFHQLAEKFQHDKRYKFFQFGKAPKGLLKRFNGVVRNVPVRVNGQDRNAMARALERQKIDVVVCWSLWPETFNITVHEAMAGGAFIVARRQQGNVWPAASCHAPKASRALEDDTDLTAYLQSGQLLSDLANSPRYSGKTIPSAGSAELLL